MSHIPTTPAAPLTLGEAATGNTQLAPAAPAAPLPAMAVSMGLAAAIAAAAKAVQFASPQPSGVPWASGRCNADGTVKAGN